MIYKKYVFGHSDDENIFLIYSWCFSRVPDSQLQKPLEFPREDVFYYVNEATLGKP